MKIIIWLVVCMFGRALASISSEREAEELYEKFSKQLSILFEAVVEAERTYEIDVTFINYNRLNKLTDEKAAYEETWKEKLKQYDWKEFKNEDLKRKFKLTLIPDFSILPSDKYERISDISEQMIHFYTTASVCHYKNRTKCDLSVIPDLEDIFMYSRDVDELAYYWKAWRDATGKKSRKNYKEFVDLANEAARLSNYTGRPEMLHDMDYFESDNFEADLENIWDNMEPLYKDLHGYVRGRLREYYGEDIVSKDGPIPCHLLGGMWSQVWTTLLNITVPYPNKQSVDVTEEMVKQGYTPLRMFKAADEFFVSLNLSSVPESFWNLSTIEKPKNSDMQCQPIAYDLTGNNYMITMCTKVNQDDFVTVHHEMGHIQYFMQYRHQPKVFRFSANTGFHEAIGDVIAMSVTTPSHLKHIGLLSETFQQDMETTINFLFLQALDRVAPLPYNYLLDKWRWDVYRGIATENDYNCHYWKLRLKYQGIQPPVDRSEEDLDPFAKFHVAFDRTYIRYFVSSILQYQFHKALCEAAGQFDPKDPDRTPLYNCNIYGSTKAGEKFKNMLKMGTSKPWPVALEVLTGTKKMSSDDLLEYFKPLQAWLQKENKRKGYAIGWTKPTVNICKKS